MAAREKLFSFRNTFTSDWKATADVVCKHVSRFINSLLPLLAEDFLLRASQNFQILLSLRLIRYGVYSVK